MRPARLGTLLRRAGQRRRRGRRRQAARVDHVDEAPQVALRAGRPVHLPRHAQHPLRLKNQRKRPFHDEESTGCKPFVITLHSTLCLACPRSSQ